MGSVAFCTGEPLEPAPDGLLSLGRANFQFACGCIADWVVEAVEYVEYVEPNYAPQSNKVSDKFT